jgi:hypothetical protein
MTFTSGVVGLIAGGEVGPLSDDYLSEEVGEDELECYIDIQSEHTNLDGDVFFQEGLIAAKRVQETKKVEIGEDNQIDIQPDRRKDWEWTRFWHIPDSFVVAQKVEGPFPFDKLSESANTEIRQAQFTLTRIVQDHPGQWMGGFQDREERVRSGTLYGEEIEDDREMGNAFINSDKNQIGPIIEFDGQEIKARVSKDGLVQVVSPGRYEREKYLRFIEEILLEYSY